MYQVSPVDLNTSPKITPNTFFCSNKCLKCYQIQKRSIFNLRGSTSEACYFYYHNFIQLAQINFVAESVSLNTGHFAQDFSHKSFSTGFGLFAQFLVVISHNSYK